jgi:hypothetical protein
MVVRKPHYWLPWTLLYFVLMGCVTYVPVVGHWLRVIVGDVYAAALLALAYTQAGEGRISPRRALALVRPAVPTLVLIALFTMAVEQVVELPILRAIATDDEFALYAFARMGTQARHEIDLVHSVIGFLVTTPLALAAPLAVLHRMRFHGALRLSFAAFMLSPGVYLGFFVAVGLAVHSLAYLGPLGALALIAIELLFGPAGYLVFRSAFGEAPVAGAPAA